MSTLHVLPALHFKPGQRVIERFGSGDGPDVQHHESEIVHREGNTCLTDTGHSYDCLTGAADPKGNGYRSIRSVKDNDRHALNLLGGTETATRATPIPAKPRNPTEAPGRP